MKDYQSNGPERLAPDTAPEWVSITNDVLPDTPLQGEHPITIDRLRNIGDFTLGPGNQRVEITAQSRETLIAKMSRLALDGFDSRIGETPQRTDSGVMSHEATVENAPSGHVRRSPALQATIDPISSWFERARLTDSYVGWVQGQMSAATAIYGFSGQQQDTRAESIGYLWERGGANRKGPELGFVVNREGLFDNYHVPVEALRALGIHAERQSLNNRLYTKKHEPSRIRVQPGNSIGMEIAQRAGFVRVGTIQDGRDQGAHEFAQLDTATQPDEYVIPDSIEHIIEDIHPDAVLALTRVSVFKERLRAALAGVQGYTEEDFQRLIKRFAFRVGFEFGGENSTMSQQEIVKSLATLEQTTVDLAIQEIDERAIQQVNGPEEDVEQGPVDATEQTMYERVQKEMLAAEERAKELRSILDFAEKGGENHSFLEDIREIARGLSEYLGDKRKNMTDTEANRWIDSIYARARSRSKNPVKPVAIQPNESWELDSQQICSQFRTMFDVLSPQGIITGNEEMSTRITERGEIMLIPDSDTEAVVLTREEMLQLPRSYLDSIYALVHEADYSLY